MRFACAPRGWTWARYAVPLLLLCAPGCWIYTGGDKTMVSLAGDQVRRAALDVVENLPGEALDHLQLASDALAAMNGRHGHSPKQWKKADAEAAKQGRESIGAYKAGTRLLAIIAGYARGMLGFFTNSPLRSALMGLLPIIIGIGIREWMKRQQVEKDALATVDNFKRRATGTYVDESGEPNAAFHEDTAALKEVYKRRRG